jgi:hypothetical protein
MAADQHGRGQRSGATGQLARALEIARGRCAAADLLMQIKEIVNAGSTPVDTSDAGAQGLPAAVRHQRSRKACAFMENANLNSKGKAWRRICPFLDLVVAVFGAGTMVLASRSAQAGITTLLSDAPPALSG